MAVILAARRVPGGKPVPGPVRRPALATPARRQPPAASRQPPAASRQPPRPAQPALPARAAYCAAPCNPSMTARFTVPRSSMAVSAATTAKIAPSMKAA